MTPEARAEISQYIREHPLRALGHFLLPIVLMRVLGEGWGFLAWLGALYLQMAVNTDD